MIREISILILAFSISIHTLNAAELAEVAEPPAKKSKLERKSEVVDKPEVAIDLSPMFRKDVVVELALHNNEYLTDINFVLGFPTLTSLNLMNCYNLKDNYHPVSQLTNLRTLNISGIGLTTTKYLKPLTNLISLNIGSDNMKECLKYIVQLPSLKDLTLEGTISGSDQLSQLSQLISLEKLSLSGILNNDDGIIDYVAPSIDCLSSLISLRTLDLSSNDYLFSIKPILNLPSLTDLNLSGSKSIIDLREISKLKSLVKLNLGGLNKIYISTLKEDLKSLEELKNLRELIVSIYEYIHEYIDINKMHKEIIIRRDL